MSKPFKPKRISLGNLFTIQYGYIGGPEVEMVEHILAEQLARNGYELKPIKGHFAQRRTKAKLEDGE